MTEFIDNVLSHSVTPYRCIFHEQEIKISSCISIYVILINLVEIVVPAPTNTDCHGSKRRDLRSVL